MSRINNFPKVSIIMPTYNRADYINETIVSILLQTYQNWELIIVDDGSDDNTEEIITGINDQRIRFYKVGRIGVGGKIKNIGMQRSGGDLIAFIDSDDLWAATKLEKQVIALQQYPEAGFSLTGGYNFKVVNEPVEYFYKQKEGVRYDDVFISCFKSEVAGFTQALMFRKECLAATGVFKEDNSFSDMEFIISLASHFKAVILYEPLFYRRLHHANESSLNWEKWQSDGLEILNPYKDSLPPKVVRDFFFRSYINFGEKCIRNGKNGMAIHLFLKAWKIKPFNSIAPKKLAKAILYSLHK